MATFKEVMGIVGVSVLRAGAYVGKAVANGYLAIDPDARLHILQVPLLSYALVVSRRETITAGEPDGHPPLIFVHGLGGMRGNFLLMGWYLRMRGRTRSYAIHFEGGQSIDDMAQALADFIKDVKKATGEKQVDIVAHSLGGIVARLAVNEHKAAKSVNRLITLGTPHLGTMTARFAATELTLALRSDSEFMQRLNQKTFPKSIKTTNLYSHHDLFVLPAENACVEGCEHIEMPGFTHYSYLIDPRGFAQVAKLLGV